MPSSSAIRIAMIAVSVRCAFGIAGFLKIGTAFDTASTPVIAVQPLANALISSHHVSASVASGIAGNGSTGSGLPPVAIALTMPMTITIESAPTNAYVGT